MRDEVAAWSDGDTGGQEVRLPGGNVGGAVRIGETVRRHTGPWTPAVHALLGHLDGRVPAIPRVLGFDGQGREVLSYLPGRVVDIDTETLGDGQIVSLVSWTRSFHEAVTGFSHPGPWRYFAVAEPTLIGHNDLALYNACFDGDTLAGVFDWDLAGPTTPLLELAFIAWNCVPLWADIGPEQAAARLSLIASAYGSGGPAPRIGARQIGARQIGARQILHAVPNRIRLMLDWIPAAAAAGDAGMVRLMAAGEPGRSAATLADLITRIPAIDRALAR